jgi:hypothetical protein
MQLEKMLLKKRRKEVIYKSLTLFLLVALFLMQLEERLLKKRHKEVMYK